MAYPPLPASLSSLSKFLSRADKLSQQAAAGKTDPPGLPRLAYFCRYAALETGVAHEGASSAEGGDYLGQLFDALGAEKSALGVTPESQPADFDAVLNYAMRLFVQGDKLDRAGAGLADAATAKRIAFGLLSASEMLEVFLVIAKPQDSQHASRARYARIRAADIMRALREGTPVPPCPGADSTQQGAGVGLSELDAELAMLSGGGGGGGGSGGGSGSGAQPPPSYAAPASQQTVFQQPAQPPPPYFSAGAAANAAAPAASSSSSGGGGPTAHPPSQLSPPMPPPAASRGSSAQQLLSPPSAAPGAGRSSGGITDSSFTQALGACGRGQSLGNPWAHLPGAGHGGTPRAPCATSLPLAPIRRVCAPRHCSAQGEGCEPCGGIVAQRAGVHRTTVRGEEAREALECYYTRPALPDHCPSCNTTLVASPLLARSLWSTALSAAARMASTAGLLRVRVRAAGRCSASARASRKERRVCVSARARSSSSGSSSEPLAEGSPGAGTEGGSSGGGS